jgi:hypothetical protein
MHQRLFMTRSDLQPFGILVEILRTHGRKCIDHFKGDTVALSIMISLAETGSTNGSQSEVDNQPIWVSNWKRQI